MIVVVDADGVRVDSPAELERFHVEAPSGLDVDRVLRQAGFGHLDPAGADAHVSVAAIRAAVEGHVDPVTWGSEFDGMLGYARSKGWLDEAGGLIRGHIERT